MTAVGDLLNTLIESGDTSLPGVYIGGVMPSDSEWEKMRRSLPIQVCFTCRVPSHSEISISCMIHYFYPGEEKTVKSCLRISVAIMIIISVVGHVYDQPRQLL